MNTRRLQPTTDAPPNEMIDKAKRIWNMLDELSASDPKGYKDYIEKTLKEGKDFMAPPAPTLAVRSRLMGNPRIKIFYLNIFTWQRLPTPVKNDIVTKMYSLTPMELTYNNEPCILVNIAVHPDVMKIISSVQLIRSTFDLVSSQHQLLVDYEKYQILQEKFVGNLPEIQQNFVQPLSKGKKSDDAFEEFTESGLSPTLVQQLSLMTMTDSSTKKSIPKPSMLIEELWSTPLFTEEITNNNSRLTIRVSLPECESVADCDVTVLPREDLVQIECEKFHTRLKLDMKKRKKPTLPDNFQSVFDIQRLTAKFVRKTQQLILNIPILIETKSNESKK